METDSPDGWSPTSVDNILTAPLPPPDTVGKGMLAKFACGPPTPGEMTEAGDMSTETTQAFNLEITPSTCGARAVHVEVCVSQFNVENFSAIELHVVQFLRRLGPRHVPTLLSSGENHFVLPSESADIVGQQASDSLQRCVASMHLLLEEGDAGNGFDASCSVDLCTIPLLVHVYQLVSGDEALPIHENIEIGSETINGGTVWLLPSMEMNGLWDSLIYDSDIKLNLLSYAQTALLFADAQVSVSVISWNRVVLLYGPPGTGKTSLCRALANKLAIRMADRYTSTKLIELNTMNLMSKWFSESARLVARMFDAVREYLEFPDHLVCLLVDEVESLTAVRNSAMSGVEPSDAIRVVNAVLTQIDQIKRYPNVLVLATSNVTGIIDPAFLDRADIRLFIGPPSAPAIYTIYRSCLLELMRVGLIQAEEEKLLSYHTTAAMRFTRNEMNSLSLQLWELAESSVGLNGRTLRKIPLLAHAFYLTKVSPGLRSNLSFSGRRVHLSTCQSTAALQSGPVYAVHPQLGQSGPRVAVSLPEFLKAIQLAVEGQFAEVQALDLASTQTGRLRPMESRTKDAMNSIDGCHKATPCGDQ